LAQDKQKILSQNYPKKPVLAQYLTGLSGYISRIFLLFPAPAHPIPPPGLFFHTACSCHFFTGKYDSAQNEIAPGEDSRCV
jgi:hypothetical protein